MGTSDHRLWHVVKTFSPFNGTAAINNALKRLEVLPSLKIPTLVVLPVAFQLVNCRQLTILELK